MVVTELSDRVWEDFGMSKDEAKLILEDSVNSKFHENLLPSYVLPIHNILSPSYGASFIFYVENLIRTVNLIKKGNAKIYHLFGSSGIESKENRYSLLYRIGSYVGGVMDQYSHSWDILTYFNERVVGNITAQKKVNELSKKFMDDYNEIIEFIKPLPKKRYLQLVS